MPTWTIYGLASPADGVIRYVGKSCNPASRLAHHLRSKLRTHAQNWIRKVLRDGLNPVLIVLEAGDDDGWRDAERRWIASFPHGQLTNHTAGGDLN